MHFEIHLTVKEGDILQFREDCNELSIKPILIETENEKLYGMQMMTSTSHYSDDYQEILSKEKNGLFSKGYEIIREKVEIKPEFFKNKDHIYFESHLRLQLPKNFKRKKIEEFCKINDLHLSKNLFKIDDDFDYQMITYRRHNSDIILFTIAVNQFESDLLKNFNIKCDKIEIEECIFDSNISIDKQWLTK